MRFFIPATLIISMILASGAVAQTVPEDGAALPEAAAVGSSGMPAPESAGETLDRLFSELRRTRDAGKAAAFAKQIDDALDRSSSATVTLLIKWSDGAEDDGRTASALDFLSEAIALRPDEPAAYRKRAVIHYTHGDINRAMDDIRTALDLEPRDIGALGLMATILDQSGRPKAAAEVWRRYLELYPADREIGAYADNVDNELAGKRL